MTRPRYLHIAGLLSYFFFSPGNCRCRLLLHPLSLFDTFAVSCRPSGSLLNDQFTHRSLFYCFLDLSFNAQGTSRKMRSSWKSLFAVVLGALAVGLEAQIQAGGDLNSVLSSQKNLTTFYSLVKVCPDNICT